jgi:phosphopantetheine--protein transferase-like protein
MIGNDIVDLKYSAPNWKRPRFLNKVFTKDEQSIIFSSENKHETLWLLWSMKEAAYKIHVQQFGERFFNPKRLVCELKSAYNGVVVIDKHTYFTRSIITEDYVYTTARLQETKIKVSAIFKAEMSSYSGQSELLKKALLTSISKTKQLPLQQLDVKKSAMGIPELYCNDFKRPLSLSLTHCGRYSGFAY